MLPERFARKGTTNIPMPLMIAGGVVALVLLVFGGVALTMGTPPVQETVVVDVPLE